MQSFSFEAATKVAEAISGCDFRTAVSRYTMPNNYGPWVITVGESDWHRQLVIENIGDDGSAALGLLSRGECYAPITNIRTDHVERRFTLLDLTCEGYVGVKRKLGMPVNG
jgi:hypothetical protein